MKEYLLEPTYEAYKTFLFTKDRRIVNAARNCNAVSDIHRNGARGKHWYGIEYDPRYRDAHELLTAALDGDA